MNEQVELSLRRAETQENILDLKNSLLPKQILNFFGRALKKKASDRSLIYWFSNFVLLNLIIFSPWIIIGLALKEYGKSSFFLGPGITVTEVVLVSFVVIHILVQNIFEDIAYLVVGKISNTSDLSKLVDWLRKSWSLHSTSKFILSICVLWVVIGTGSIGAAYRFFIGFGFSLTSTIVGILAGIGYYGMFWISSLATALSDNQYELNAFSPADSEIISNISEILTKRTYITAVYFAIVTLIGSIFLIDPIIKIFFMLPFLLSSWIVITVQFLFTRSALGKIVNKATWKTLNKIQIKINLVEASGDLSDKETAERLLRLVDIHRQIQSSRKNTFNLKSISTFFSQLMLPLLGLLLGNLDKLLEYFK